MLTWDMTLEESTMKKHCIALKSPGQEVFIQAVNPEEMQEWMQALRKSR